MQSPEFAFHPIAFAHTPFSEKFSIPRQPGLAPAAIAKIELIAPFNNPLALDGLEQVSHVWLLFHFHGVPCDHSDTRLRVRPPRLGGNEKIGVFASRSTHRPNGIGQSLVKVERIEGSCLWVSGVDLLNGTPIIDIKPYVPYADCLTSAYNHIAPNAPERLQVDWCETALCAAKQQAQRLQQDVIALIEQCLAQDPRPAYQQHQPEREYGAQFWDINVRWRYPTTTSIEVINVTLVDNT
jgi:tRNA-Thr(GGU) m(6)t(6)A37 methyltransferase TsaA